MTKAANDTGSAARKKGAAKKTGARKPVTKTDAQKRASLRERIEAGERRNAERSFGDLAREAKNNATTFAKRHPFATVAGAVVVGLAVGAMTRPGRRLTRKTGALAVIATDAALAYGLKMLDSAGDAARGAGDRFGDLSDSLGTQARHLGREARTRADVAGDAVRSASRKVATGSGNTVRDLRSRFLAH